MELATKAAMLHPEWRAELEMRLQLGQTTNVGVVLTTVNVRAYLDRHYPFRELLLEKVICTTDVST